MKTKIYLLLLFLMTINGFSQETKMSIKDIVNFSDLPSKNSETPRWANQFYTNPDLINIPKLKDAINDWVNDEKKEKKEKVKKENGTEIENDLKESESENPIVRFAINFINKVPNSWINERGFIDIPTRNAFLQEAENEEKSRTNNYNKTENKNVLANSWSQIGSKEIIENGQQVVKTTAVFFISVAPTSTNIRLASGETGLLYKTTDSGANWNIIAQISGPSAFHPTDENKIILGSNPFRLSLDGGATWTVKQVTAICNEILWSINGSIILAATNSGVYVSSDAGATFSLKQAGSFMDVEFKPGSSTIAYAVNDQGVFYKSTDAGLTWAVKPTTYVVNINRKGYVLAVSDANPELVCIASVSGINFIGGNAIEIIKSTNSGENFALLSNFSIGHSLGFYSFVFGISPTNVNTYFLGVCSFHKSTDGGLTFNAIGGYNPPFGTHPDIQDMVIFGNTVVLATDGGVSESTDNFTNLSNWKSTCKGLVGLDYWGFDLGFNTDQMGGGKFHNGNSMYNPEWNNGKAIHLGGGEEADGKAIFSRPNSLYFSGKGKNFKQIDINYNPNYTSAHRFTLENNVYYFGDRISDTNSNTDYSNIIYAGYENNVNVSYDNGITTQVLKSFNSKVWDVKTTRKDSKVLYVMTEEDGLWKTVDGGVNWTICNTTLNNVVLKPQGLKCYIDVSQTNSNEIWLIHRNTFSEAKVFKSTDGGQVWTNMLTPAISIIEPRQILHQYGSNGGVYLMGRLRGIAKCFYRNNTMTDWVDYSSELSVNTMEARVFLKATYHKEKLRVASSIGVQEIPFYEKSKPVAQPTTNTNQICINQEIKFCDYSILDYAGATWLWSFSKTPIYLNGTSAGSRDPIVKFLSPGVVNATLTVTNSSGISDTKTVTNFVTVNYDAETCLNLNSDYDYSLNCVNTIATAPSLAVGSQRIITNFNGATTGKFLVKLNLTTDCSGGRAAFNAIINLDTNQISVIRYFHFEDGVLPISVTGDNTDNVTSFSNRWAQISFKLINKTLYLNHISNYCASAGQTDSTVTLLQSCWQTYNILGISSGDFAELQKCNNQIPQSAAVSVNTGILVTDFGNATSGLLYVNVNGFTTCNNVSNNLKAIVNLDSDVINVLSYKHFDGSLTSGVSGNETATVTSNSIANASVSYYLSNNKLYAKRLSNTCGGTTTFRVNPSCWSAMDDDQNGIDNTLEPSNCNNPISTNAVSNADTILIRNFSEYVIEQSGVFVKLNISNSCNNTNATVYLTLDLDKNLIHVINYKHFGSATFSTVLNNDSPNVYSESDVNGKLKFSFTNDNLYIQRISTPCAGSTYQVINSCFLLGSDQTLAIEDFISNTTDINRIVAYPNPTSNSFTIDTKSDGSEFDLSIYNIDGKFITSKFEKTTDNLLQVNLEQYAEGLYFVILYNKTEDKYNYLKIIKK